MGSPIVPKSIPWLVAACGAVALGLWLRSPVPALSINERIPGLDRLEQGAATRPVPIDLRGTLLNASGAPGNLPGEWPRFRGANFDNISDEPIHLSRSWGSGAPPTLWTVSVGEGYAGAAVLNGRVYVLDYDQAQRADTLKCLSLADGQTIWQRSYPVEIKRNHGMSRTVPAVTEKFVVTMGPKCHVLCADAVNGAFLWGIDLPAEYNTKVPPWYAGQCPLIDDGRAIIAPGGDALMIAVDCATGRLLWKTPNTPVWDMTHSSIVPMTFNSTKTYVYCGSGGVAGVSAADGSLLWSSTDWKVSMATVPSPLVIDHDRIFLSGGYGAGSMMIRLKQSATGITAETVFRLAPEVFGSEQQTPILFQGHIYGVIPSGQLVCLDLDGKPIWTSGGQRFGIGPYLIADGAIFLLNDKGVLFVVEAGATGYREISHAQLIPDGHESWGPMALAGGRLIARDLKRLVCVDLKEPGHD